ncbi:MAG: NAD-dependent epimerase/dehydratase family protein [Armatimonadetes bacterium]|nr:NAD-dependent epimerase/dehydratase family protein [Armatimonadota bacterium]NIM23723.1 NAD-dependent epimerase/dehydratase family protein [Armatimonadota bacterium]NIM67600.1 NAD-dependent epimerase/dehydratase family protein [Armatimonadota bacterium]NIM76123.1 NAD-dependent epimerase/dehydratase family protein [Armatimonadota bacterium]NIN05806.1 NAD-dependent epimerase/dehydratase family protein [Armatimonadota bacterium]
MRALITGVTGFVGSHLAEYLLHRGDEVVGTARWRSQTANIDHIQDKIQLVECDLRDYASVKRVLAEVRPDQVYHLAAQSFVHASWQAPAETLTTNIVGQLHLLEAMRDLKVNPPSMVACSSEEYGLVKPDEVPIKETNPLRPLSPYGVSKVGQDLLAYQYHQSFGTHVIRTRAFNHDGPRRGKVFATSNFAFQIAQIEKGLNEPVLRVGNLEAKRDFTDVRDIVKAYVLAVEKGEPGEVYNICSGEAHTIQKVVDILSGMSKVDIRVEQDPARMRPSDVPILLGDYSKFHALTGWKPTIPFEQTLRDLLNWWREQ